MGLHEDLSHVWIKKNAGKKIKPKTTCNLHPIKFNENRVY